MDNAIPTKISYFPGCSLATSAKENNQSLIYFFRHFGIELIELDDWNCCGSSSAYSIDSNLAFNLAARNLSLAPAGRPLLVACPSCLLKLSQANFHLKNDETARLRIEQTWGKPIDGQLEIIHFFELLNRIDLSVSVKDPAKQLKGLKFVPYYGCMLAHPPEMRHEKKYHGLMERTLFSLGAQPLMWGYASHCCGTFLSVVRPDVVTAKVNEIVQGAMDVGADCLVTACAMCHMNLEIRCTLKQQIPTLHFSEILSLAIGAEDHHDWFSRHLINPKNLLKSKGLI